MKKFLTLIEKRKTHTFSQIKNACVTVTFKVTALNWRIRLLLLLLLLLLMYSASSILSNAGRFLYSPGRTMSFSPIFDRPNSIGEINCFLRRVVMRSDYSLFSGPESRVTLTRLQKTPVAYKDRFCKTIA